VDQILIERIVWVAIVAVVAYFLGRSSGKNKLMRELAVGAPRDKFIDGREYKMDFTGRLSFVGKEVSDVELLPGTTREIKIG
jgi:hypothetical protein